MALIILVVMAALIALAAAKRSQPLLLAGILGVTTFLVTPLYSFGDVPLGVALRVAQAGGVTLAGVLVFAVVAVAVYGGLGALVCWYVRTSIDTRPVQMLISVVFAAAISGMAYMGVRLLMRQMTVGLGPLFISMGTGAAVSVVVAFAMTHERPENCSFFESRDGWTVASAMLGVVCTVAVFHMTDIVIGVLMRQPPPPYGVRTLTRNLIAGALLGSALTIPLRAIDSGRFVRSLLGGIIGSLAFAVTLGDIGGIPLAGLAAGAAVGAMLPDAVLSAED